MAIHPDTTKETPCTLRWHQSNHASGFQTSKHQSHEDPSSATILIVEDDPANLQLATQCMEMAGYRIISARNGSEAVDLAFIHQPDVVLMDIQMPVMNGYDAIQLINRDKTTPIAIMAVTAMVTQEEELWIRASGCDDYLVKPYVVETLLERVAALLTHREEQIQPLASA